jgi:4-amino-4-deoxy-L-arabinose transferase-like glycosyltransferase
MAGVKSADSHAERYAGWYAAAIVAGALVLRLYQLGTESLWLDEGFSLRDATYLNIRGETRPLYFVLLRGWMSIGGDGSEFLLRLPSAIFGAAAVWIFFTVGRRLVGTSPALLASVFMAISVLHVNHSQEVRMYSLTSMLTLLSTYFFLLFIERGRAGYLIGYVVSAVAGLLAFPLTVLIVLAHGVFLLLYVRAYGVKSIVFLGGQLVVALIWVPWLLNSMHATSGYSEGYTATLEKPTVLGAIELLGKFFLWKWTDPGRVLALGALGFSILVFAVALHSFRGWRRTDTGLAFAWIWLIVPVAGLAVISYAITNMWMVHYLIAASPAAYLLVSRGIHGLGRRYLAWPIGLAIIALTLGRLGMYYMKPMRAEWRPAVEYVQDRERPGDIIGLYYSGNQYVFQYYYHGASKWLPLGSDRYRKEDFGRWNEARVATLVDGFPWERKRFWLILSHHTFRGGFSIIDYFTDRYRVLEHRQYNKLELYLFDGEGDLLPKQETL